MKSTEYSDKVMDHFRNPRNVGVLEGNNVARGKVGNPTCGDIMEIYLEIEDDVIKDAKFRTFGCGSAIATTSMTTEMVKGMTVDKALELTRKDVAEELDGLPPIKMHCSNLATEALHEAIVEYKKSQGEEVPEAEKPVEEEEPECVVGQEEYMGRGVYTSWDDKSEFEDKRVLVLHSGDESVRAALELTKFTNRVVLLTPEPKIVTTDELKGELRISDVKVLYESRLLEIKGEEEVEKARIVNLDEDEEYELFVDAVLIIE